MIKEHSRLPPSSAARRMACPGSRAMEEQYGRNEESDASREGDLAHELAAWYLTTEFGAYSENYTEYMRDGAYV